MPSIDPPKALADAIAHHRAGRLDEAEKQYRNILQSEPADPDALNLLGVLMGQRGQIEAGIDLIQRAIAARPNSAEFYCNLGNFFQRLGKQELAVASLRTAISLRPDLAKAHYKLSLLLYDLGNHDEAIVAAGRAIELRADHAESHNVLGSALMKKSKMNEAIAAFRRALDLNPGLFDAHRSLGICLAKCRDTRTAVAAFNYAIALRPNDADSHCNLGTALKTEGRLEEAIAAYRRAIELDSEKATPYQGLSQALARQGRIAEAITALKAAQERSPGSARLAYELAALGVGQTPRASPREYLVEIFDEYAETFDRELLEKLDYRAPQLLFEAVTATAPRQPLDILDLGCGTGLCGALFRPMARHLTGVDLAPEMIEKSRQRGVYDELKEEELTAMLRERHGSFDLILAADVFIYMGRLEEVFEAAARALRPNGLMAFTIESTVAGEYVLRHSLRYAQSIGYIRRLATECRLDEVSVAQAALRKELGEPVEGLVIVLRARGA